MSLSHSNRIRTARALATGLFLILAGNTAHAQLSVTVRTNDVDDSKPGCFMYGTLSTQTIDVKNQGAAAVSATLACSVPSGLLRISGVDPAVTIQPGATATMRCALYDFQDPPAPGATVTDFTVDVNGQSSTHSVDVVCRPAPKPVNRCAVTKIQTTADSGAAGLRGLAAYVRRGDPGALNRGTTRAIERLVRGFGRANQRFGERCTSPGDLAPVQAASFESFQALYLGLEETGARGRCDASRVRSVASWLRSSGRAWRRNARDGDTQRLADVLRRIDRRFQQRWVRISEHGRDCSPMNPDWLKWHADRPLGAALDAQDARRPAPGFFVP